MMRKPIGAPDTGANATINKLGYSYREARLASSLSRRTLEMLVQRGVLESVKVGKRVIIRGQSLEELLGAK